MAEKHLQVGKRKVAPRKAAKAEGKTVLVGTYKAGQLERWPGWYNYPISAKDRIDEAAARRVTELWLFRGKDGGRYFAAEFAGVKTRAELVGGYGYRATGKAHGEKYLLYKLGASLYEPVGGFAEKVIVRAADFARTPKVRKQIKAYLESPDRNDPLTAGMLPTILTKVPPQQLCVCEPCVQMEFVDTIFPCQQPIPVAEESDAESRNVISMFSGAMGLDNGIEKAGLKIRLCVEFQHAMAETIRANKPDIPLIEDDVRNYSGADLLRKAGMRKGEEVFLVCGGPPCQAFSTAGKRLGFDDDRGNVSLMFLDGYFLREVA